MLGHAVQWNLIVSNPAASADPPRVRQTTEIEILAPEQIKIVLDALRGRWIYPITILALATGARRGELCALRWKDVDLNAARIRVERSLEQTNAGLRFKEPKTKAGRRSISIPSGIVAELRAHWRAQQEQRLAVGAGRAPEDALLFARSNGEPIAPDTLTQEWGPPNSHHGAAEGHVSRAAPHPRLAADRERPRRCNGQPAPRARQPDRHPERLLPPLRNTDERAAAIVEATLSAALSQRE